jgi:hypothetical protein
MTFLTALVMTGSMRHGEFLDGLADARSPRRERRLCAEAVGPSMEATTKAGWRMVSPSQLRSDIAHTTTKKRFRTYLKNASCAVSPNTTFGSTGLI